MTAADEAGEGMSDRTLMDADRAEALPAGGSTRVVLVTGMSGAGRSSALRVLEDEGYDAIDNLPLSLLSVVVNEFGLHRPIAVAVAIPNRYFALGPVLLPLDSLPSTPLFSLPFFFFSFSFI